MKTVVQAHIEHWQHELETLQYDMRFALPVEQPVVQRLIDAATHVVESLTTYRDAQFVNIGESK